MSATRAERRHPKAPVEDLLVTRKDVIAFASYISKDEGFCGEVARTLAKMEAAELAAMREVQRARVAAMPKWRRILHSAGFVK